jgi:hypothetical protein
MNVKSIEVDIEGITIKETKSPKSTWSMTVTREAFLQFSHLFHTDGRPKDKMLTFGYQGYAWTLYASFTVIKPSWSNPDWKSVKIYGSCGDSTFGNAPGFYNSRYSGNKRAAKHVYTQFLKMLTERRGEIVGKKFGF